MLRGDRHIVLVGLMGTGKSTLAGVLAERLGRRAVDTDALVEERAGRTVREIWAERGEACFRDLEASVLHDVLASTTPLVVACGGGVVLREENRRMLNDAHALVVQLDVPVAVLVERVQGQGHRPLLDGDAAGMLATMARERAPFYEAVTDVHLDAAELTPAQLADVVLGILGGGE